MLCPNSKKKNLKKLKVYNKNKKFKNKLKFKNGKSK